MQRTNCWIILFLFTITLLSSGASSQADKRLRAEKLFVEAQKYLSRGEENNAQQLLKDALEEDPRFTSAIWQLAQIYRQQGKLTHARELMLRGLEQKPDATWARDELTRIERNLSEKLLMESDRDMAKGEYEKALPKLSLYIGINPYQTTPLIQMSRCHLALGNLKSSKWYLQQASRNDPENVEIISLLNEVNRRIEDNSLQKVQERARNILADYSQEKEESAREALRAVLDQDPGNKWAQEKLNELELITSGREKQEGSELKARSVEKLGQITEHISSRRDAILKWTGLILLAITAILVGVDIRKRRPSGNAPLQGSLDFIPILDLTSLLNSNLKTGRMQVHSDRGRGEIFFEKGEIVHARFKTEGGKKAFHQIMNVKSGTYKFSNRLPKVRHTITEPLSLLLLSMRSAENSSPPSARSKAEEREPASTI